MNPGEHLSRLDDAPRGSVAEPVEHVPAGTVDAGKAENVNRHPVRPAEGKPRALGGETPLGAFLAGPGRVVLVHPTAAPVSVDARRREVADPLDAGEPADHAGHGGQHRVAAGLRRGRDQYVGRAVEEPRIVDGQDGESIRDKGARALGPPRGADDVPELAAGRAREGLRAIAEAEADQLSRRAGHTLSPGIRGLRRSFRPLPRRAPDGRSDGPSRGGRPARTVPLRDPSGSACARRSATGSPRHAPRPAP